MSANLIAKCHFSIAACHKFIIFSGGCWKSKKGWQPLVKTVV